MSHLDYYIKHNISPVRYDLSSVDAHFERRASLYRSLGLLPLAFRHADVLEVAVGSGQNSFYVASLQPRSLTLLEPNPRGIADIQALYGSQKILHTAPTLIEKKLEDFRPNQLWDVVLCENWLGASPHERGLLRKLGSFVAKDGMLVVTAVSPIGFAPNMIRRALAAKLSKSGLSFEARTQLLVSAFSSHLATIDAMTRSAEDWVHDNMMNPAYFDLCLTVPMIVEELGAAFEVVGSNPVFAQDWRWFKALHGDARQFNAHFLHEYRAVCHNFFDYRAKLPMSGDDTSQAVENAAHNLINLIREYENKRRTSAAASSEIELLGGLSVFVTAATGILSPTALEGIQEAIKLLGRSEIRAEHIAGMESFSGLFGRETLYVSLNKK